MDTVDKAAGLSDNQLADAVNKEWLLESARSSQLSTDLRRYKLELSLDSTNSSHHQHHYGATSSSKINLPESPQQDTSAELLNHPMNGPPNAFSWLRANYISRRGYNNLNNNDNGNSSNNNNNNNNNNTTTTTYSISNHLYDNISFADSPILRSLSRKDDTTTSSSATGLLKHPVADDDDGGPTCCFGRFRLFLACYVLFGITLAMYSRNALSLAAVGMMASNQINRELVDILAAAGRDSTPAGALGMIGIINATSVTHRIQSALDGSCPVNSLLPKINTGSQSASVLLPGNQTNSQQVQMELEQKFRASIRRRIEAGELVDWSPSEQGLIFAAGSVGNLLIAIPLSRLGEIYGPKWIIFVASLGATIQAALMPLVSPCHVSLVIIFQVIFNGLTFGADCVAYTFFAHWLPPTEMAFFVSCLLICYQLGAVLSSFITSKILADGIAWSWCFYTPAILCGIWTLLWALVGSSEPSQSRFISRRELLFLLKHSKISSSMPTRKVTNSNTDDEEGNDPHHHLRQPTTTISNNQEHLPISWLKLARDPNIWAIIAVKFTLRWYFSVYASMMPTYLASVAHMSIGAIGNMSVFQSFVSLALGILLGYLTKSLVSKRPFNLSLATTRKIFQSIVNFGLALSMLVFIMYDCNQWVTIVTLTLGGMCINFYCAAALQLPLDLSPKHCGLITSITNTLALGQAIGAPISGVILNSAPKDRGLWRIVWGLSIVINVFSGLIFILLVDSKPRDYTKYNNDQQSDEPANTNRHTRQAQSTGNVL